MSRLCPLFSGSSGNSTYISTPAGALLIDAGASYKALTTAITEAGGAVEDICAVAVTHEHIDHVKGLKHFLKNTRVPLIASSQTLEALAHDDRIPKGTSLIYADEGSAEIGDMLISRFETSHDCAGSSGYTVCASGRRVAAVCTDLGIVTDAVRNAISGFPAVVIESNHDIEMLRRGPYPAQLKLRILSDEGHLSNNACAAELPSLLKSGTSRFVLAHISRNNNLPMLALSSARAAFAEVGAEVGNDLMLTAAKPGANEVIPL